ncbi:MAG: hypothetical protein ACE3JK_01475 [Sporolactobacillus sp.]
MTRMRQTKAFITDIVRAADRLVRKQRLSKRAIRSVTKHRAFFGTLANDPLWRDSASSCNEAIAQFETLATTINAGDPLHTVGTLEGQLSAKMTECGKKWNTLFRVCCTNSQIGHSLILTRLSGRKV